MKRVATVPEQEPLGERISVGLSKLSLALKHQSQLGAGVRGLSPMQGQVLVLVAQAGALRPSEVAERLAVSLPTVSASVRVLVDKGLLAKDRDALDARASVLRLTAAGRAEASHAASWPDFLRGAVDVMDDAEQEVFFTGLVKMIRTLQERGQVPVSRMCVSCRYFRPNAHPGTAAPHHCAYVDAAMGARHLRLECPEHETADEPAALAGL